MTLDAPVAKEKQPEPINKQQMNEMMQNFAKYKENYDRFKKGMERIQKQNAQLIKTVNKEPEPVHKLEQVNKDKEPMNVLVQIQDLSKHMENYDQFKKQMDWIQKHGTCNFMVTNEFAEKMTEICEKMGALNALIPNSIHIQPIRKRIQLTIKNCREIFTKAEFDVSSKSVELIGFKWFMVANSKEKGFLALFLHAEPPNGSKGNYRIEVDLRFSILNASLADKDLVEEPIEQVYTLDDNHLSGCGWGCAMAKFEDLLDPNKTFLTPEGDLETWVDFTIKSATLNHLA